MGKSVSGSGNAKAAPFQRVYTSFAAAVDLTEAVSQAKCATSALVVTTTASTGAGNLVWKDCSGTTNTLALPAGVTGLLLPFSATTLEISTIGGSVVAVWHAA